MNGSSDERAQNQTEEKSFMDRPAEYQHVLPPQMDPEVTQGAEQKITSLGVLFRSRESECKARNENSASKTESTAEEGTNDSDSLSQQYEATAVVDDVVQQSDALPSNEIPTCSITQVKIHTCGENSCIYSNPSSQRLMSTVTNSLSENEDPDIVSPNSAIPRIRLQELLLSEADVEISPCPKETPPNVFFPKGKIYEQIFQIGEEVENTIEPASNIQTPTPAERHQWVKMSHKYIQKECYRLGINPGTFYSSSKGYFVEVTNGANYEIILTNENPVPCNVDVFISSEPAISFRLNPGKPKKFDGPTFCDKKFVFLRSKDAPSHSGIKPSDTRNGIIQAIFTPQKIETVRTRTTSEPIPFSRNLSNALVMLGIEKPIKLRSFTSSCVGAERGVDLSRFCEGSTALRGEQSPKMFKKADSMEVDDTRRVVMRLRLIARIDDPSLPSEEDICSLYPPSVEELLKD